MWWQWCLFVLFVFILGCLWIFLYMREKNKANPNIKALKEREAKVFKLYQSIEDLMDSFEEYVNEMKLDLFQQIKVSREEIFRDIESAVSSAKKSVEEEYRRSAASIIDTNADASAVDAKTFESRHIDSKAVSTAPADKQKKIEAVYSLIDKGYSVDEIAKELDIGKGEVNLIFQIRKNNSKD